MSKPNPLNPRVGETWTRNGETYQVLVNSYGCITAALIEDDRPVLDRLWTLKHWRRWAKPHWWSHPAQLVASLSER